MEHLIKILVVGENSFIGKHLHNHFINGIRANITKISLNYFLNELKFNDLISYDSVINCAYNPLLKSDVYKETLDYDYIVGQIVIDAGQHYVMLSSRKVYGQTDEIKVHYENNMPNPCDYYSENKLRSEYRLCALRGSCAILRGSNLYGYEPGRKSFMGYCMDQLVSQGSVEMTFAPYSRRDFIDIDTACSYIIDVCKHKLTGVYNLCAGYSIDSGDIVKYLIKGYGSGYITCSDFDPSDQFAMDNFKMLSSIGKAPRLFKHEQIVVGLGIKLNEAINFGVFLL